MISKQGLNLIKKFEGFVPLEYLCVAGKRTIGYGHVLDINEHYPCGITQEKGEQLLAQDVLFAENAVDTLVEVPLTLYQKDALVSFVFNVGVFAFSKSTLLRVLNNQEYDKIPKEFQRWIYAAGKPSQGLINRRQKEAKFFKKTGPKSPVNFL